MSLSEQNEFISINGVARSNGNNGYDYKPKAIKSLKRQGAVLLGKTDDLPCSPSARGQGSEGWSAPGDKRDVCPEMVRNGPQAPKSDGVKGQVIHLSEPSRTRLWVRFSVR